MTEELHQVSDLEDCPQCASKLPHRLASGRIVCSKCGWTDQPKTTSTKPLNPLRARSLPKQLLTRKSVEDFIKTRQGERILLIAGTFMISSFFWSGMNSLNTRRTSSNPIGIGIKLPILQSNSYSIKGSLTLVDSKIGGTSENCYGSGGYSDISAAMPVTIKDGEGKIIATGTTGIGIRPESDEYSAVQCNFDFTVDNVPKADFYSIKVGHRGELNYSLEEMQKREWKITLSLG
jgi:hypothetical protein